MNGILFVIATFVIFVYMIVIFLKNIPVIEEGEFYANPLYRGIKPLFNHIFHMEIFSTEKSLYIFENLFYILIHILMSFFGILLIFRDMKNNMRLFLFIVVLSGISFFIIHFMIYGLDYFFSGTENYLSSYHRPLIFDSKLNQPLKVHQISNSIILIKQFFPVQIWSSAFCSFYGLIKYKKIKFEKKEVDNDLK